MKRIFLKNVVDSLVLVISSKANIFNQIITTIFNLLQKTPLSQEKENRNLSDKTNKQKFVLREIEGYTELLQDIIPWMRLF